MDPLEPLLRLWRRLDDAFERVEPTAWGAVVTDGRFPTIWDVNYARVETDDGSITLREIERDLRPALVRAGAGNVHTVLFHPEAVTGLLAELGTRGDRLSWESVMICGPGTRAAAAIAAPLVEEVKDPDEEFWRRFRESLPAFDVLDERSKDSLVRIEREVVAPLGKRWFGVRDGGALISLASLLVLEDAGYVDHVVTFPEARRRGHASALVIRLLAEADGAAVESLYLLVDRDEPRRIYERLGFREITKIASSLLPIT